VRTLSCAERYRTTAFAQLTYRESLRDIETCLSVQASKLYSMGFRDPVRRSTLALPKARPRRRRGSQVRKRLAGGGGSLKASVMASRIDQISLPREGYRARGAGRRPMSMAR